MREKFVRRWLAMYVLFLILLLMLFVSYIFYGGGLDLSQFTTLSGMLVPMFCCYGSDAMRILVEERYKEEDTSPKIIIEFVVLSFVIPTIFLVAIGASIWGQVAAHTFMTFEQFKIFLMFVESTFAVYMSSATNTLFAPSEESGK